MAIDLVRHEEAPHLTDLLVQMEDVLDASDIYVFPNWFDGEIVEGPIVSRYWLGLQLKYEEKPDERAALRLIKQGIRVEFARTKQGEHTSPQSSSQREETAPAWLVSLQIPRRLIADMNADQLDFYDDAGEIDVEDVQDAQDAGMNDETGLVDQDQGEEQDQDQEAQQGAPGAAPPL